MVSDPHKRRSGVRPTAQMGRNNQCICRVLCITANSEARCPLWVKSGHSGLLGDVRFAPKSGHRNRPAYYLRRSNSGSLAIFAAIRRASSRVSGLAADLQSLIWIDAGLFGAAGAGASSAGLSRGNGFADEARRCGLTPVSTTWLNELAIADGGTSGMSAGGLGMSSSDALGVGSGGLTSLMAPRRR